MYKNIVIHREKFDIVVLISNKERLSFKIFPPAGWEGITIVDKFIRYGVFYTILRPAWMRDECFDPFVVLREFSTGSFNDFICESNVLNVKDILTLFGKEFEEIINLWINEYQNPTTELPI